MGIQVKLFHSFTTIIYSSKDKVDWMQMMQSKDYTIVLNPISFLKNLSTKVTTGIYHFGILNKSTQLNF